MQQRPLKLSDVIEAVEVSCASQASDLLEVTALHEAQSNRRMVAVLLKTPDGDIKPSNVPEGYEKAIWEASLTLAKIAGASMGAGMSIRLSWRHGERETVTVSVPPQDDDVVDILRDATAEPSQDPRVLH